MEEILNANQVDLVIKSDAGDVEATNMARIVVDDFNFTFEEDNEPLSGVGNAKPVGITRGDMEYSFSFTVQGEDGELLETVATDDGRSRQIEFVATGDSFTVKMVGGFLTSLSYDGSSGDAVEWAAEGVASDADMGER